MLIGDNGTGELVVMRSARAKAMVYVGSRRDFAVYYPQSGAALCR